MAEEQKTKNETINNQRCGNKKRFLKKREKYILKGSKKEKNRDPY